MTPEKLASELGMSAKTLRAWLRGHFPRPKGQKGTRWVLTREQIDAARSHWRRCDADAPHAARDGSSLGSVSDGKSDTELERVVASAKSALSGSRLSAIDPALTVPGAAGLYAIYGAAGVWKELGLGAPPDDRPLYVGKAQSSLVSRDLRTHFGDPVPGRRSKTGRSTVRRSLAALLASARGYRGLPRNPSEPGHFDKYGLSPEQDRDLTAWMLERLRLAVWPYTGPVPLERVETEILCLWSPPINLDKVLTPWHDVVDHARRVLRQQAFDWAREHGFSCKG